MSIVEPIRIFRVKANMAIHGSALIPDAFRIERTSTYHSQHIFNLAIMSASCQGNTFLTSAYVVNGEQVTPNIPLKNLWNSYFHQILEIYRCIRH